MAIIIGDDDANVLVDTADADAIDGDSVADFLILVSSTAPLTATDFLL